MKGNKAGLGIEFEPALSMEISFRYWIPGIYLRTSGNILVVGKATIERMVWYES